VAVPSRVPNEWTLVEIKRFFSALEQYNSSRDFEKMAAVIGANKNASQVKNFYYKCLTNLKKCYSGTGSQVSQRNPTAQMELLLKYWHLMNCRPCMLVAERSVFSRKITNQLKENLLRARHRTSERANLASPTAGTAVAAAVVPTVSAGKITLLLTPDHEQECNRRLQYDLKTTKRIKDLVQRLQLKLASSSRDTLRLLPVSNLPAGETPALSWDAESAETVHDVWLACGSTAGPLRLHYSHAPAAAGHSGGAALRRRREDDGETDEAVAPPRKRHHGGCAGAVVADAAEAEAVLEGVPLSQESHTCIFAQQLDEHQEQEAGEEGPRSRSPSPPAGPADAPRRAFGHIFGAGGFGVPRSPTLGPPQHPALHTPPQSPRLPGGAITL
jgi:hypothetical protein